MKIINCLHSFYDDNDSFDLRTRRMLAEAYRLVAHSYEQLNLFDQSNEYYHQVCEILQPVKDNHCLYRALFDLARNFMLAKRYSQSIEIFHRIFQQTTTDHERAFVFRYISLCYLNDNQLDQAKHYAYEALDYAVISNNQLLSMEVNFLLSKIYSQLNDSQRAEEYLQYAQNLQDQLGDLNGMKDFEEIIPHSPISDLSKVTPSHWRILTPYYQLFDIHNIEIA